MEHATQKQEDMTIPEAKRSLWGQWPFKYSCVLTWPLLCVEVEERDS